MDISASTALVTGANRGLGRRFAAELVDRGAKVYAAARKPETVDLPGVIPVALDITDPASVAAAVEATGDVNLLINNAGSFTTSSLLTGDPSDIRLEMETHFFGTLSTSRGFVPQIEARGGAILNVLSVLSWIALPTSGAYSAAKGAEWQLSNALRVELAAKKIRVASLHVGYLDTDMASAVTGPKHDPRDIARLALDALADDEYEIVADEVSRNVRAGLAGGVSALYPDLP